MSQQDKKFAKYEKDNIRKKWKRRKKHLQSQFDENQALEQTQVFFWFGTAAIGRWMEGRQITNFFDVQDYKVGNKEGVIYRNSAILEVGDAGEWKVVKKEMFRKNELCEATQGSHEGANYYGAHRLVTIGNLVCVKWGDRGTEEWLPSEQVQSALPASRSRTSARNYIDVNRFFCIASGHDYQERNDGIHHLPLPFHNIETFVNMMESWVKELYEKDTVLKAEEEAAKAAKKEAKAQKLAKARQKLCKKCGVNQARRKGEFCTTCATG